MSTDRLIEYLPQDGFGSSDPRQVAFFTTENGDEVVASMNVGGEARLIHPAKPGDLANEIGRLMNGAAKSFVKPSMKAQRYQQALERCDGSPFEFWKGALGQ